MIAVTRQTHTALAAVATGKAEALAAILDPRAAQLESTGLDKRTAELVRIAVLIAVDAPPASYAGAVAHAVQGGATGEDIVGVLRAVAPQVGGPRVVAAAPEIMLALGLALPDCAE